MDEKLLALHIEVINTGRRPTFRLFTIYRSRTFHEAEL